MSHRSRPVQVALALAAALGCAGPSESPSGNEYAYTAVARVGSRELHGCAEQRRVVVVGVDPQAVAQLGDWEVVDHRMPGVTAMSAAEAATWHGRVLRYEVGLARAGADSCRDPLYRTRVVGMDSLLSVSYHITPSALGLAGGSGATLTLIEVYCGASPRAAPGGTLLQLPDGRTFTVWDGTFFELRRR